ncbi:MAG TPA: glycosyltransferase family 39 protein [Edaphobacter sp.]|jgi:4-amino-4-deoxy-L-arabinose transferase-like glycosyltransferase|nr:glycosyltransferase family 39 protein [Edaphobacter sp.]
MMNLTLSEIRLDSPAPPARNSPHRSTALFTLTILWMVIYFASLFTPPLLDDADATHANAARHMALTGDLVTLQVDGIRYLEKAPLPYWLVALSSRIFGFNTFAAHLPQAIAVFLLALLGFHWATRAFNPRTAFYTGLATLTSAGVFLFTRYFIPEVLLSLFLCAALYCFLQALDTNQDLADTQELAEEKLEVAISTEGGALAAVVEKPVFRLSPATHAYLMWTALAFAILTKGLVALVFFFGTAAIYLVLTGEYKKWRKLKPLTGFLLFLAIAAPWHILAGLRNTGGMNGHGFFWFYFVNEHFLRFLGKRYPKDYNKLPGYLFWTLHLIWLFPWSLFGGTLLLQGYRAWKKYNTANPIAEDQISYWQPFAVVIVGLALRETVHFPYVLTVLIALCLFFIQSLRRRQRNLLTTEFLLETNATSRHTILLTLFATLVLFFFSLSTNQEYYTFPAYLPLLILIAAALTHAESTYTEDKSSRRWITFAHATFTALGAAIAAVLAYGLWTSRHEPFVPDIGDLLAHRGVGNYTLSMSALFDLTGPSFAALRLPAALAALAFLIGPAAAWFLRSKQRHLASTTTIALTSMTFLIAAHIAFARFAPMLSSKGFADTIQQLEANGSISPDNEVLLYGDQAYGSSIPFYLGRSVFLVNGRTTSMLFGSTFPDAPAIFLTSQDLQRAWGHGNRKILFVPIEKREEVDHLLSNKILLKESSGKTLYTDHPLDK